MMLLSSLVDEFIADRAVFCLDKTLEYYMYSLSFFLDHVGRDKKIGDLHPDDLREYVVFLRSRMKSTSVRTYCRAVVAFLNWVNENNEKFGVHIDLSPLRRLPRADPDQIIPLSCDEVDIIDQCFDLDTVKGLRDFCMFHLMLDCGLRRGEIVRLKKGDVVFLRSLIHIRFSKFGKSRTLPVPAFLLEKLQAYSDLRPDGCTSFFWSVRGTCRPVTSDTIHTVFFRLKSMSGVSRIHPHLCRHTFASSFVCMGGSLEMLRIYMGHFDYSVTRMYLHIANEFLLSEGDLYYKLDSCFFKKFISER